MKCAVTTVLYVQENIVIIATYRTRIARLEEEIRLATGVGPSPPEALQVDDGDAAACLADQAQGVQDMDVMEVRDCGVQDGRAGSAANLKQPTPPSKSSTQAGTPGPVAGEQQTEQWL